MQEKIQRDCLRKTGSFVLQHSQDFLLESLHKVVKMPLNTSVICTCPRITGPGIGSAILFSVASFATMETLGFGAG